MSHSGREAARALLRQAGAADPAVAVFLDAYDRLAAGETGLLREEDLTPVDDLPRLGDLAVDAEAGAAALAGTAVIKLNGGLGTSMGMTGPKSLLEVRDGRSFLDLTVAQILRLREAHGARLPLILMNSFRTRRESLRALERHPDIQVPGLPADFLQGSEPKLLASDLSPVGWPADPELEWCPPGHGDLYPALLTSGLLDTLLAAGFRTLFVANADNLGAVPEPAIAAWFTGTGAPIAVEFCRRTPADRKGGHLARRSADGRLVLRESAQTGGGDAEYFADIDRHRFFNTNNLWLDLPALAAALHDTGGVLGLPVIRNVKTVDPADPDSPEVIQIESAMGSAISVFADAQAIEVPRSRFLPVKTTEDLLLVRSDAYRLTAAATLELDGRDTAPLVRLDDVYKLVHEFDRRFPVGPPSLKYAESLTVHGDWTFGGGVSVRGSVVLDEPGGTVPDGTELVEAVPGELS